MKQQEKERKKIKKFKSRWLCLTGIECVPQNLVLGFTMNGNEIRSKRNIIILNCMQITVNHKNIKYF